MAELQNNNKIIPNSPISGINTDNITSQLKDGQVTYALNAVVQNFDGKEINYQNEQSNVFCSELKQGYKVVGRHFIPEQNKTIYFMHNPITDDSEIGYKMSNECIYHTLINSKCLNLNVNYPILKIVQKTTNCTTELYWTDNYNTLRFIDLDNLPFKEIPDPNKEGFFIKLNEVDCNKLRVQPNFAIPSITPISTEVGGNLQMGSYQFAIQYSNSLGEGYTSMYAITNPLGIFESKETMSFDLFTTKAIKLKISNIDNTGLYDHFNLVVLKTINGITTPYIAQTVPISGTDYDITYTGNDPSEIRLSMRDVFDRFPYYDLAGDVTSSDNTIVWSILKTKQKLNYQNIWSNVRLYWESWKVPVNRFESYNNPINTGEIRGYMRDENYSFYGCFILRNGKITERFHIPGRMAKAYDLEIINNLDAVNYKDNPCETPDPQPRWKVYNTANVIDFSDEYKKSGNVDCYKGPYQYGEFGYFESTEKYPNNKELFGSLAGQYIRLHKFPDCIVSPIHDNNTTGEESFQHFIFPIGVKIDSESLYNAIQNSDLTQEEKDDIVGFKIVRANRAISKSVVAKGLFFNVGKYSRDNQEIYYPNYNYNDLRPDPFIATSKVTFNSGDNASKRLQGFGDHSRSRITFHSPDTSFYQPFGIDSGYVKMETIEYGKSKGHFVAVQDNARYKFMSYTALKAAFGVAMSAGIAVDLGGGFLGLTPVPKLQPGNIPGAFISIMETIKNIIPFINYGWQYNSIGNYGASVPIPNNGNKIRAIQTGSYLISGMQTVDGERINNYRRESSVYIKTSGNFLFPHEYGAPVDNSRFTISSDGNNCSSPEAIRYRDISTYYGSIKRIVPDQYGKINSPEIVDTGYFSHLYDNGNRINRFPTVFGGDVFINQFGFKRKHAFFLDNTVSKPDNIDIALNLLGNVGYPIYYYSTDQIEVDFKLDPRWDNWINILTEFDFDHITSNILSAGIRPAVAGMLVLITIFRGYLNILGVPNVNLDCYVEKNLNVEGKAYLFSYGIPYFFCESEVNLDYRQAYNSKEGDFYPHVSSDIPDFWLQEINVPIIQDNTYIYNKSYSKQNKEILFNHLPENFDPNKSCTVDFPNRAIYSQKANLEETKNNWLVYRPISYHDFPKTYGRLTSLDGLESRTILARFENKSQLYNVLTSVDTTTGTAYLGNPIFFSQPPIDFAETETGYAGSQHKFLLKTEYGHLSIDSVRGQIFLLRGNHVEDISSHGMSKWFTENLPFRIKEYFPNVNIDNHYKDIGLTGVYDTYYNRLIVTKKDYIPLLSDIIYDEEEREFKYNNKVISTSDTNYFCNKSWTVSYSIETQSWVSFHSYVPNYYTAHHNGIFETGIDKGVYLHNKAITFCNFYGELKDYIIEYPIKLFPDEEILSNFQDYTTVLKYTNKDIFYEVEDGVYFNQCIIYNDFQNSGLLKLIQKPKNNLSIMKKYPMIKSDHKEILYTKSDSLFKFNTFWDIVINKDKNCFNVPCNYVSLDKQLDNSNLDYSTKSHLKARIRSREARIRLIYNQSDQYKLISKFFLTNTQKSIK